MTGPRLVTEPGYKTGNLTPESTFLPTDLHYSTLIRAEALHSTEETHDLQMTQIHDGLIPCY